jgi:hypothetical protein
MIVSNALISCPLIQSMKQFKKTLIKAYLGLYLQVNCVINVIAQLQ